MNLVIVNMSSVVLSMCYREAMQLDKHICFERQAMELSLQDLETRIYGVIGGAEH